MKEEQNFLLKIKDKGQQEENVTIVTSAQPLRRSTRTIVMSTWYKDENSVSITSYFFYQFI